jgi:RNA-directed DNA polymerase
VPHAEIVAAVEKHTGLPWVVLYVKRWLVAPSQHPDGRCVVPGKGTPQGSAISPLLSNHFLHYALDSWLARRFPVVQFERYCDDMVLHCYSQRQARFIRHVVEERLLKFGLRCHPEKTRIVYCKQGVRDEKYPVTSFTFLGFDFRRAPVRRRDGVLMCGFVPLVGKAALKSMTRSIRQWKLGRRTNLSFQDLAAMVNPLVSGWINYYGRFYKSRLMNFLEQCNNPFLAKWAMRKYKRLRHAKGRTPRKLAKIASAFPGMFGSLAARRYAHWFDGGSHVKGDFHTRFCERRRVRFPPPTHLETHSRTGHRSADLQAVSGGREGRAGILGAAIGVEYRALGEWIVPGSHGERIDH